MQIGELSARTGASVRMLRYYEEQGLLEPRRTGSGYRDYARVRCGPGRPHPLHAVGRAARRCGRQDAAVPPRRARRHPGRARGAGSPRRDAVGRAGGVDRQDRGARAQPRPVGTDRRRRAGGRRGPGQARRTRASGRSTRRCARPVRRSASPRGSRARCGCSSRSCRPPTRWPSSPPRSTALPATPGVRWTRPEQWHVTLAFLAEVDDRTRAARSTAARAGGAPARPAHAGAGGRRPVRQAGAVDAGGRRPGRAAQARRRGAGRRASVRAADRRAALPPPPHPRPRGPTRLPTSRRSPRPSTGSRVAPWTASDLHLVRSVLGAGPGGTAKPRDAGVVAVDADARS